MLKGQSLVLMLIDANSSSFNDISVFEIKICLEICLDPVRNFFYEGGGGGCCKPLTRVLYWGWILD